MQEGISDDVLQANELGLREMHDELARIIHSPVAPRLSTMARDFYQKHKVFGRYEKQLDHIYVGLTKILAAPLISQGTDRKREIRLAVHSRAIKLDRLLKKLNMLVRKPLVPNLTNENIVSTGNRTKNPHIEKIHDREKYFAMLLHDTDQIQQAVFSMISEINALDLRAKKFRGK